MAEKELKWVAPEFEFREKSPNWYWISIIFAVILVFVAIWQKNYLFGLVIVVAEILVIALGSQEPRLVNFHLTETHLLVDDKEKFHFTEMAHWSAENLEHKDLANILIHFHRPFNMGLKVHIPKQMLPRFREIIRLEVEELHRKEGFADFMEEFLGF